ncbi:YjjG family noncanonical pyrimidine nucleotidase [Aquimarina sp. ERC-38]|uniref:YjjG family noncanonical pyrimidine nucleotidase n=1 Tax=Aquimarina sp. ERC-38 TaxID=2949996 RepID=UPI002245A947|nr:YjjG family noncanonical pyrimidine nucleotidase [Aquimarina sp. ERC-38]UZO80969.1 YjjG family noncanonical pyrimidine nucleotidase [Aquimarina sp. ERC-38]
MNNIKHIFFDLDHTLWDFDRNSKLAFKTLFEKYRITLYIEDFLEAYKPINLRYWKLYREGKITQPALRRGRLQDTFTACQYFVKAELIEQLSEGYIKYLPKNNFLITGAAELLSHLHPSYSLHIITNGFREIQHKKLKGSKIEHYFTSITNSEDAGVKKPNPKIFEYALHQAEATVEQSLMIGDNYEADILGARDYGLQTLFFNYHQIEVSPVENTVSDLLLIKNQL